MKKFLALSCSIIGLFVFTAYDWDNSSSQEQENQVPVSSPAMGSKAAAITTASRVLGSGSPEERQVRMESLKRLSAALAKAKSANPTPAATYAPAEEPMVTEETSYQQNEETTETQAEPVPAKRKSFWGN